MDDSNRMASRQKFARYNSSVLKSHSVDFCDSVDSTCERPLRVMLTKNSYLSEREKNNAIRSSEKSKYMHKQTNESTQ